MNLMYIPSNETNEWLAESSSIKNSLSTAYRECIKSMFSELTYDPRFIKNDHIVNMDFQENPIFVCGLFEDDHITISILYVFPKYRRKGVGSSVIEGIQKTRKRVMQLAVAENEISQLHAFYNRLGFKTLNIGSTDDLGITYIDYYWGNRPFEIEKVGNRVKLNYINNSEV